jgi:hypothetical protein
VYLADLDRQVLEDQCRYLPVKDLAYRLVVPYLSMLVYHLEEATEALYRYQEVSARSEVLLGAL